MGGRCGASAGSCREVRNYRVTEDTEPNRGVRWERDKQLQEEEVVGEGWVTARCSF